MSVQEIENEITKLAPEEVGVLLTWLSEYGALLWDKQIEHDVDSGKLDALLADVDREYDAGLARPL